MPQIYHKPAMCEEVLGYISQAPAGFIVDATLGDGGHSRAILERIPASEVIGIDRDIKAKARATERLEKTFGGRFRAVRGNFGDLKQALENAGVSGKPSGVLFDFGLSSAQLDDPERGMSFSFPGPLDMRMGPDAQLTLQQLLESADEKELCRIIKKYGEEKFAKKISREVKKAFETGNIQDTCQLGAVIESAIPARIRYAGHPGHKGVHPATRTFQAFRIEVNRELEHIENALGDIPDLLAPGAVAVFISYHSLEDRLVKRALNSYEDPCKCPKNIPECVCGLKPVAEKLTRRPERPTQREIELNPRSRSAKLRAMRMI